MLYTDFREGRFSTYSGEQDAVEGSRLIDFGPMNPQDEGADDVSIFSEFSDPRLVAIYDTVNTIAEYEAFYIDLARRLSASSIIDIGCGTGLLTCELAKRGHRL